MLESRPVDLRVPFTGRAAELRRLLAFLERGGFLTVVGAGGVGKTRLTLEAVERFVEETERPYCFVPLAGVAPEDVYAAVLHALEESDQPSRQPLDTIHEVLSDGPFILVLDNCEQAPDEAGAVVERLRDLRYVTVIATSQRRLDYENEEAFELEPFTHDDGIAFFAARSGIELGNATPAVRETLASICRSLDGLPVALDLAAARLASLSLKELAAQLSDLRPYQLRSTRGSDPRHRTIGNVIAWTHSRLSSDAKRVFALASRFNDEFTAVDMAALTAGNPAVPHRALSELAENSLLSQLEFGYRMLLPIRAVAARSYAQLTDRRSIDERFAKRVNAVALQVLDQLGNDTPTATRNLSHRYADFCDVLGWALKRPPERFEAIADVPTVMIAAWAEAGRFNEGLRWTERLRSVAERLKPKLRGRLYYVGLAVAHAAGQYALMMQNGPATISAFTIAGDQLGLARAYNALAAGAFNSGLLDDAAMHSSSALRVYRQIGHARGTAAALTNSGNVLSELGDLASARLVFSTALDILEEHGTDTLVGIALGNLAEVDARMLEFDAAADFAKASIAHFEAARNLTMIAWMHEILARTDLARHQITSAKEHLHLCTDLLGRAPQPLYLARLGEALARLLLAVDQIPEAALALTLARKMRVDHGLPLMGYTWIEGQRDEKAIRAKFGDAPFTQASERAAQWDVAQVPAAYAALLVGIGRSEPWRNPDTVDEPSTSPQ